VELAFTGKAFVVRMPFGLKDPNELHKHDVERFADNLETALGDAEPVDLAHYRSEGDESKRDASIPRSPPRTLTAAELMGKEIPEPRWVVDGLLTEGLCCFAGKPKVGKSWLALHLAVAVACGGTAFNEIRVAAGDVLYLALEDNPRRLQSRLRKLLAAGNQRPPDRLHLETSWPRLDEGGIEHLDDWLLANPNTRLVIVDVWPRLRPRRKRAADIFQEDYDHGALAKKIADDHHCAILVIHHCRKLASDDAFDTIMGTVGTAAAADTLMVIARTRGQRDAILNVTGRDVDEKELALRFDANDCHWSLLGDAAAVRLSREREQVLELLASAKAPMTPKEIAGLLSKPDGAVRKLLWTMANDGQIAGDGGRYFAILGNCGNRGNSEVGDR
jgi:hypothetical protein